MADPDRDEELAARLEQLTASLEELRGELSGPPPRGRGPLGLPGPLELLRFADEHAIPTAIAVLEANVRALELLQGAIRMVDRGESGAETATAARRDAERLGRESLARLEGVLADLERAMEGRPPNDEARRVLREARQLREDVERRLRAAAPDDVERREDAGDAGEPSAVTRAEADESDPTTVDVESELRTIKRDLGVDDGADEPGDDSGPGVDTGAGNAVEGETDDRSGGDGEDGDDGGTGGPEDHPDGADGTGGDDEDASRSP